MGQENTPKCIQKSEHLPRHSFRARCGSKWARKILKSVPTSEVFVQGNAVVEAAKSWVSVACNWIRKTSGSRPQMPELSRVQLQRIVKNLMATVCGWRHSDYLGSHKVDQPDGSLG